MLKKKNDKYHLTDKELELMELLWKQDKPLTSVEILSTSNEHSWSDNYLPIMLKSLLEKKAIEVCGYVRCGTQYARQFKYSITKEEYVALFAIGKGLNSKSIPKVAVAMVTELQGDKDVLIKELDGIIQNLKK